MTCPDEPRIAPARALLHPLWLGACALLVANDHFFKGAGILHELATGKLSDFAGLIVAPALVAALAGARSRRALALSHLGVGLAFSALQLAGGAALAEQIMSPFAWQVWPDPTDLVALPMLALSWRVLVPAMERARPMGSAVRESGQIAALVGGLLACLGTSSVPPPAAPTPPTAATAVVATDPAEPELAEPDLAAVAGRWRSQTEQGFVEYRFEGDRYRASGHPAFDETGRIEVVQTSPRGLTVRLVERIHNGQPDEPLEIVLEVSPDRSRLVVGGVLYQRVLQQVAAASDSEADITDELLGE